MCVSAAVRAVLRLAAQRAVLTILVTLIVALGASARAACQDGDLNRALSDLSNAESMAAQGGLIGDQQPNIDSARRLLERCSFESLAYSEMEAGSLYLKAGRASIAAQTYAIACRHSEQIEETDVRRAIEYNCKQSYLIILISLDDYQGAVRVAQDLRNLANAGGLDTTSTIEILLREQTDAARENKFDRVKIFQVVMETLANAEVREALAMASLTNEAQTKLYLGEYGGALEAAVRAHQSLESQPEAKRTANGLRVILSLASAYLELGQYQNAATVLVEGEQLAPEILSQANGNATDFAVANYWVAQLYEKVAVTNLLTNDPSGARTALSKASSAAQNSNMPGLGDYLGLPRLEGQAAIDLGSQSAASLQAARGILSQSNDVIGTAILSLSESLSGRLSPTQVAQFLESAPQLLAIASPEDQIEIHTRLARALDGVGNEDGAVEQFLAAIELIEAGRYQSKESEALPSFFARYIDIYREMVAALYARSRQSGESAVASLVRFGQTNSAIGLYFSEAAHARRFSELYGASLMRSFGVQASVPDSVITQENGLRASLGQASRVGYAGVVEAPVQARQKSEAAATAYVEFVDGVRRQYPRYAALAFPRPIGLDSLPSSLDGKFIVSYMVADRDVYWWLIFNRSIIAFERAGISKTLLRQHVTNFVRRSIDTDDPELCEALIRGPFGQIAKMTTGQSPPRVIIIPDDTLYAVPWEALCGLRGASLGEEFIISYAPSLTILAQAVSAARSPARGTALLVGNAQDDGSITTVPGVGTVPALGREQFSHTISSVTDAGFVPVVLEGPGATRETLLGRDLTSYDLVYFDTHAFARGTVLPSLLLHQSASSPYGLFDLSDVAQLRLKAQLVTLSACETALGSQSDPVPGEGIESLARLFMLSGAKSVIATLWPVQSDAAGTLMQAFYRELGSGGAPDMATALFRAKAATRAMFKSREHWTGFILIGDPGA